MKYFKKELLFSLIVLILGIAACDSDDDDPVPRDCSTNSCTGGRLNIVITKFFEDAEDQSPSASDIAQFWFSDEGGLWEGGRTDRSAEADFVYEVDYLNNQISTLNKNFDDDLGQTADVDLTYYYNADNRLDYSESLTVQRDSDGVEFSKFSEIFDYTFAGDGKLTSISYQQSCEFGGCNNDSYDFEFLYENDNLVDINLINHSNGTIDYNFKHYVYNGNQIILSTTRVVDGGIAEVFEEIDYEYYEDGPLKRKVIYFGTQKSEFEYVWEEGGCDVNVNYGDRHYPTPDLPNFPCA